MNFIKALFTFLILGLVMSSMSAQIPGETFRFGGDLSFDKATNREGDFKSSFTILQIQLSPGYFIAPNLLTSVDIRYAWFKSSFENSNNEFKSTDQGIGVGPSISYYIPGGANKLYFPLTIYGGYQYTEEANFITNDLVEGASLYYGGSIAIEFIPSKALGLRFSFGPNFWNPLESEGQEDINTVNWQARLGTSYYFFKGEE